MTDTADVAILMGSRSDWNTMKATAETLREFGVSYEARVLSAHRTPSETARYVEEADAGGTQVFIAAAGMAAHLAGAVAAHTVRPVIGVPLSASDLNGLDALLATVQMPPGMPAATVAIGKAGAVNAALLAISILGLQKPDLQHALVERRHAKAAQILAERLE